MNKLMSLLGIICLTVSTPVILKNEKTRISYNNKNYTEEELIGKKEDNIRDPNNFEASFNGIIKVNNFLYGAMVGNNKITFYRIENKINSKFELIKTFQYDIQLKYATTIKGLIDNDVIYYQSIVIKNNKNYVYIYKLNLTTLEMTELGNQLINNNMSIFNGNKSEINICKCNNKIIFIYQNISLLGGGIVILDLKTEQLLSIDTDHLIYYSTIYKNKIWFSSMEKDSTKAYINFYDLKNNQLITMSVDTSSIPTSFFTINEKLYATVSPLFSENTNLINLFYENNAIVLTQVSTFFKRNLQIINSFAYLNNNYLIYKYIDDNSNVEISYAKIINFSLLEEINILITQISPNDWIDLSFTNNIIHIFNNTFSAYRQKVDLINYNILNNKKLLYYKNVDERQEIITEGQFIDNNWLLSVSVISSTLITNELYRITF